MKLPVWLLAAAWPAAANMVSMSSGDLSIQGSRAHYELHMPLFEVAHVKDPARELLQGIHFSAGGRQARLLDHTCREDAGAGSYECTADYEFAEPPARIEVECSFASITVPNHVHLLRAQMDGRHDQALFDLSFPKAALRFQPPSSAELAATQGAAGSLRALGGAVQILFLAALVLAARSRRELMALAGMFLAGQIASATLTPMTGWHPAARFVEAAAALTIAYLAMEVLLLPKAGARWVVAGILGAFHGLYFELFLQSTGYRAVWVLGGAVLAEVAAIAVLALVLSRVGRLAAAMRPVQVSASALLAFGIFWFFLRLKS